MKRSIVLTLVVAGLILSAAVPADAGIFGRGRGIFRGGWGSRNAGGRGSCGAACGTAACGPAGCSPSKPAANPNSEPVQPR